MMLMGAVGVAAAAVGAAVAAAVGVAAQGWTSTGQIEQYSSGGCSSLQIPQATCFNGISSCVRYYTQYVVSGTNQARFASNAQSAGLACCPDIVGSFVGNTFTAVQPAGLNYGPSTVTVAPYSSGQVRMTFTDSRGFQCSNRYNVVWGVVAGTGVYQYWDYYGWAFFWVWLPILLFFCFCCVVCCASASQRNRQGTIYRPPPGPLQQPPPAQMPMNTNIPLAQPAGAAYGVPQATVVQAVPVGATGLPTHTSSGAGPAPPVTVVYNPATGKYEQRQGDVTTITQV